MESIKIFLKDLIIKSPSKNKIFQRNILKEYLQIIVLDFIYSHKNYSDMIFYGGSCLAHCFALPRLSEDLDFVDLKKKIKIAELAKDIEDYFNNKTDIKVKATVQKFRIYLKFSLLYELALSKKNESDLLFLKVEIFDNFIFCKNFKTEIVPLFKYNKSLLIKTFDLPTLMSTKIRAVLMRKWEKTDKSGNVLATVKGRDYFDLMWYLEKNIKPNIDCFLELKDKEELKNKIIAIVDIVDPKSIEVDLEPLIADNDYVKKLSKNIKDILKREIENI